MNTLEEFKSHLLNSKKKHSKATIKNYVADVNKFIKWTQASPGSTRSISKITPETINLYKLRLKKDKIALASTERYLSSLRLFFTFLKSKDLIHQNPFDSFTGNTNSDESASLLSNFKLHLLDQNISKVTIKNYLVDISQFNNWANSRTTHKGIDSLTINEYKYKLINEDHMAAASVNRKLSSIRKYLNFLYPTSLNRPSLVYQSVPILAPKNEKPRPHEMSNPFNGESPLVEKQSPVNIPPTTELHEKPSFETLLKSQAQNNKKINENKNLVLDVLALPFVKVIESIQYATWKLKGGKIFKTIPSEDIKTKEKKEAEQKKINQINNLYHKLRHSRPKWYAKYHSYPIANYIHISVLLLFTTILGINLYKYFYNGDQQQRPIIASSANSPPKTLSFQGKLTDAANNPITTETPLRFSLYNNKFASGSAMLWQETQTIVPDQNGEFKATLGQKSYITSDIFSNNPTIYIGMTVGNESELKPRRQIATAGLSTNSEKVQGLIPITQSGAGTTNVLLALDSAGNLTIGENASPTFQATGGSFTLSGKTLILTSISDSNIELTPDGAGIIALNKPIQNITNNNNIESAQGAVEIDDLVAILATSSGQSALTINQNGAGPIISASASGIAMFTLESNGTGTFAGNLVSNGDTFSSGNTSFKLLNTTTNLSISANTGSTTINNTLIAKGGLTIPATHSLIVSGNVASNLTPFANNTYDLGSMDKKWNNAYVNNLQASSFLGVNSSSSAHLIIASSSGVTRFTVSQSGNVNINGSLCIKNSTTPCINTTPGTIYATNTTLENADLAENYISSEYLEPGDIIMPEAKGNNLAVVKTSRSYEAKAIGIVSTKPGITLNSEAATDADHPHKIPIGLAGRVPVKVTTENGIIKTGDNITTSSIPGVGMKATKSGQIIGKALEDYTNPDPATIGKVLVFVNLSYATGQDEKYNLSYNSLSQIKDQLIQDLSFTAENISIGGQTLKDYISSLVQSTIKKELANKLPPLPTPASPLADNSASPSATYITNVTNIYQTPPATPSAIASNSASPLATESANIDIASSPATPNTPLVAASSSGQIDNQTFLQLFAKSQQLTNNYSNLASLSAFLKEAPTQGLVALGPSTLSDVSIAGNLNINGNLILADNSINTLGNDLQLQPLRQANLSIMAGLVSIDTNGNLKVSGNATFAKNVTVKGNLQAKIIAPIPDSDLIFKLNSTTSHDSNFTIQNSSGSAILSVNNQGNLTSSGSAKFASLNIIRSAQADNSLTQTTASSSAGTATITKHETERTIINPYIKEDSLIYLTATSNTQGLTPYIARQTEENPSKRTKGSFTIAIPYAINADIKINWWIIN